MEQYAIRGGQIGYDRLKLLARAHRKDTLGLFERAGVGDGMRCLDLGCGGGEVTFDLARLVGDRGHVVGIDLDEVKIGLAREVARAEGLPNVEFVAQDLTTWSADATYDVVYTRFLLQHLRDPADLLKRMWAAVHPGGVLIVEDGDFDGFFTEPPNGGFDAFLRHYLAVLTKRGMDATIGRKLHRYFREASIPDDHVTAALPIWTGGEEKTLVLSTLETTADAMIAEGVATRDEVEAAIASLAAHTADPGSVIGGPSVVQVWARRAV